MLRPTQYLAAAAGLILITSAAAAPPDEHLKRRIFDHDQCANQCQIELDQRRHKCLKDLVHLEPEQADDCAEKAADKYDRCLRACPENPREQ